MVRDMAAGGIPYFMIDLNDTVGIPSATLTGEIDQHTVGPFNPEQAHFAATELRKMCQRLGLCLANTFDAQGGPTYFPVNRRAPGKRLDFIICGIDWLRHSFAGSRVQCDAGRTLQLANKAHPWGHWPAEACFYYDHRAQKAMNTRSPAAKWNKEKRRRGVLYAEGRPDFLSRLSTEVETRKDELDEMIESAPTADGISQEFVSMVNHAADHCSMLCCARVSLVRLRANSHVANICCVPQKCPNNTLHFI